MKQRKITGRLRRHAGLLLMTLCFSAVFAGCARDQTQFVRIRPQESSVIEAVSAADTQEQTEKEPAESPIMLYVHVCGAVHHPGVYTFDREARVFEAIEAAGGFSEGAAEESINQARVLSDGEELYVPTREELLSSAVVVHGELLQNDDTGERKININTADVEELTELTGIGETRARAIIAWREENGGFSSPEDLKNIEGIADKTYEKIKDRITVN